MAVMIRWLRKGIHFAQGMAYERAKGDEDIMDQGDARRRSRAGEIEILDTSMPVVSAVPMEDDTNREGEATP